MSKGWDGLMLKKLKSLMGKGLSTSEMGKKLGMSKNAVVGKLNRMGWNTKANDAEEEKVKKNSKKKSSTKVAEKKTDTKKSVKKVGVKKTSAKKTESKKTAKTTKKESKSVKTTKSVKGAGKKTKTEKKSKKAEKNTEKPVIKTASKKTKKDLALHELLIQHALQMANLKSNQCRWPIGDPDSDNFHFCGEQVFSGKPYCYEHCRQAYQFTPPKKK